MNFKILFFIIANILKKYTRNIPLFIVSLLAPTFFGLLLLQIGQPPAEKFPPIGLVGESSSTLMSMVKNSASMEGKADVIPLNNSNWEKSLKDKDVRAVVLIPEDFDTKVLAGSDNKIKVVSVAGDQTGQWVEAQINGLMQNVTDFASISKGDKATFEKLLIEYKKTPQNVSVVTADDISTRKQIESGGLGMLSWILFVFCSLYTVRIISDRENKTLRRITATRANGKIFVTANVLAAVILAFLQISVALFALYYVFGTLKYMPFFQLASVLLAFAIAAIAIGTFSASINKTATNNILTLIMSSSFLSMLGGNYWPIDITPKFMQTLSFFTPQGWYMYAVRSMTEGQPVQNIVISVVLLLAFAATFFIAASYALARRSSNGV